MQIKAALGTPGLIRFCSSYQYLIGPRFICCTVRSDKVGLRVGVCVIQGCTGVAHVTPVPGARVREGVVVVLVQ